MLAPVCNRSGRGAGDPVGLVAWMPSVLRAASFLDVITSRDGAGPPERVKAGQGLTGPARAPGAVPDGDPYR